MNVEELLKQPQFQHQQLIYKDFLAKYEFIKLSGLKGEKEISVVQEKATNKIFDYVNIIGKGYQIDEITNFCDMCLRLNHPNIIIMLNYTKVFKEEQLGDPYCQFFQVFEYSESSLENEVKNNILKGKLMKKYRLMQILEQGINALYYFHKQKILHQDIRFSNIFLNDKQDLKFLFKYQKDKSKYKHFKQDIKQMLLRPSQQQVIQLLPSTSKFNQKLSKKCLQKFQKQSKDDNQILYNFKYISPEEFQNQFNKSRKLKMDPFKSEVFHLGMIFLICASQKNLHIIYEECDINQSILTSELEEVKKIYGDQIYDYLVCMLDFSVERRLSAKKLVQRIERYKEEEIQARINIDSPELTFSNDKQSTLVKNDNKFNFDFIDSSKQMIANIQIENQTDQQIIQQFKQNLFNVLPQEFQSFVDSKILQNLEGIQERCQIQLMLSGDRYQGEKNLKGEFEGWGILWWCSGDRYEGHFEKGKYGGFGVYYWQNQLIKHYGIFSQGVIQSLGVRYYKNGEIYFGEWKSGKNHGKGTYYWGKDKNGAKYQGHFLDDVIYGKGTLFWPKGDTQVRRYEGLWHDKGQGISIDQIIQKQTLIKTKSNTIQ